MSSIMRARSALTDRWEGWEVIGGSFLEPKVAGPSMLGTGCPDRHAFLFKRSSSLPTTHDRDACPPARAGSFSGAGWRSLASGFAPNRTARFPSELPSKKGGDAATAFRSTLPGAIQAAHQMKSGRKM